MSSKLETVVHAWKQFSLNNVQNELDKKASAIAAKQDDSENSRKNLIEQLKIAKKNFPEEFSKLSGLVKCFQNEIDSLNKRSKYAEITVLHFYEKITEVVDPIPILEYFQGIEKKVNVNEELNMEIKELKESLIAAKDDLQEFENQKVTIETLKDHIRKSEKQFSEVLGKREMEITKKVEEEYSEREKSNEFELEECKIKLRVLEEKYSVLNTSLSQTHSELFETKNKYDEVTSARAKEIEILENDLDNATNQINILKKERALFEKNSKNLSGLSISSDKVTVSALEKTLQTEISDKDKEIFKLLTKLQESDNNFSELKVNHSKEVLDLKELLAETHRKLQEKEHHLKHVSDYNEIKKELEVLKSIEFGTEFAKTSSDTKSLELLLLEKNKILQNENLIYKHKYDAVNEKLFSTEKELQNVNILYADQQNLVSSLESDLALLQSYSKSAQENSSQFSVLSMAVNNKTSSPIMSGSVNSNLSNTSSYELFPQLEGMNSSESLLAIVSAQRERFKIRNEELETELANKESIIIKIQNELDSIRNDNIQLYEKIKFLRSFDGRDKLSALSNITQQESKYQQEYEINLDPFSNFSQKERRRKYQSLNPFEKITLSTGRMILDNAMARSCFFAYIVFVHILIFLVLYKMAFNQVSTVDYYSDCAQKFKEHMSNIHGDEN